ncbi:MAG: LysR family transcriptional regulator [Rubripirellula sp.]
MNDKTQLSAALPYRSGDLSVQQLLTFRHVYEQSGYAAAARVAGLSVPTIWQHIQSLEKIYRVRLFEKTGRQVKPTVTATRLYDSLDQILVGLESTFDVVSESNDDPTITLVTGVRMMIEDLSQPLGDFRAQHSSRLLIRHGNNRRAEELLISGEADLALTLEPGFEQESPMIHYEPAYFVDFLAVSPRQHPFTIANTSSLKELVKHELIVTTPGTHGRDALEQALHRDRLEAQIAVETDNSGFTIACVQAGMGIGILAGRPDGQLCKSLATRSLRRQLGRRQIVFMWRKGRRLREPEIELVEQVRHYYELS